jgi:hypothetical protein
MLYAGIAHEDNASSLNNLRIKQTVLPQLEQRRNASQLDRGHVCQSELIVWPKYNRHIR